VGTSGNFNRGCTTYDEACEAAARAAGHDRLRPPITVDAPPAHVAWHACTTAATAADQPAPAHFFAADTIAGAIAGVASGAGPSSFAPTLTPQGHSAATTATVATTAPSLTAPHPLQHIFDTAADSILQPPRAPPAPLTPPPPRNLRPAASARHVGAPPPRPSSPPPHPQRLAPECRPLPPCPLPPPPSPPPPLRPPMPASSRT
jgi:hypothetical protein